MTGRMQHRVEGRTRTGDNQIHSLENTRRKNMASKNVTESPPAPLAQQSPEDPSASLPAAPIDPDLARIVMAWPDLPEPIRRAMLAMVASSYQP
jgi:hypothetical protein